MPVAATPTLSIVVPVRDRAAMLRTALQSVAAQDFDGVECVVVDGASTDGSQDVAREFPFVRLVSEPDRGLYDALNKGIALARGRFLGFLNSDDVYLPGAFRALLAADGADRADCLTGGAEEAALGNDGAASVLRRWNGRAERELSWDALCTGSPILNARLFRRDWLSSVGGFRLDWRIAADRDFLVRCRRAGMRIAAIDRIVYQYRIHPGSLTFRPEGRVDGDTLREYRDIAGRILADDGIPPALRRAAERWIARDTALLIADDLGSGAPIRAVRTAVGAFRTAPLWPLDALGFVYRSLAAPRPAATA